MQKKKFDQIVRTALDQIDFAEPDLEWMIKDLKQIQINFRNVGGDIEPLINKKEEVIEQVWKLGKVYELMYKKLLKRDGSLTKKALLYLEKQKKGELPSAFMQGQVQAQILFKNLKKTLSEEKDI